MVSPDLLSGLLLRFADYKSALIVNVQWIANPLGLRGIMIRGLQIR